MIIFKDNCIISLDKNDLISYTKYSDCDIPS